ncbi:hypothetical protein ACFV9C_42525 [Kribbella sp. NPDC059898]|uniref:hypothetical protein n=1 Tax=Kribbella sp. NPDC059898 TaxID=3346995 RepID=UPI00364F6E04
MCHPKQAIRQRTSHEDAAYSAAAYAAQRGLMLDLLARLILDPDDPDSEAELRTFLNAKAGQVRATRTDLMADLSETTGSSGHLELVADTAVGELG